MPSKKRRNELPMATRVDIWMCNELGNGCISARSVAEKLRLTDHIKTVQRKLRQLECAGYIVCDRTISPPFYSVAPRPGNEVEMLAGHTGSSRTPHMASGLPSETKSKSRAKSSIETEGKTLQMDDLSDFREQLHTIAKQLEEAAHYYSIPEVLKRASTKALFEGIARRGIVSGVINLGCD